MGNPSNPGEVLIECAHMTDTLAESGEHICSCFDVTFETVQRVWAWKDAQSDNFIRCIDRGGTHVVDRARRVIRTVYDHGTLVIVCK